MLFLMQEMDGWIRTFSKYTSNVISIHSFLLAYLIRQQKLKNIALGVEVCTTKTE